MKHGGVAFAKVALVWALGALVVGCGGGGGGGGVPAPGGSVALSLTSVSPPSGPPAGGTTLTLNGTGFVQGCTVRVGGAAATNVNVASPTRITCTTPSGSPGDVDVAVSSPGSAQAQLPSAYTYIEVPPSAPTALRALVQSQSQVRLEWSDQSNNETSFRVERRDGGVGPFAEIGSATTSVGDFVDSTVIADTAYEYRVRARNAVGDSSFTAVVSAFTNLPPVITFDVPTDLAIRPLSEVVIQVTATDPEGDPVTLTLLNPPAVSTFIRAVAATSPVTRTFRWLIEGSEGVNPVLHFQARGGGGPARIERITTRAASSTGLDGVVVGDVTGDGVLDAVVAAGAADSPGPVVNVGAIFVWAGATIPTGMPTATLRPPAGSSANAYLCGSQVRLFDVTGDGVLDVLAAAPTADPGGRPFTGIIYVWRGGSTLTGSPLPAATLVPPAPQEDTVLGAELELGDVTGDGVVDIVAPAPDADVGGADRAGAVYVWRGGPTLSGSPAPIVLTVPSAPAQLRLAGSNLLLADATGDGQLDLLAVTPGAPVGGAAFAGAIYLWRGGPTLAQGAAPAMLRAPNAMANDVLGLTTTFSRATVELADVTGDGVPDVVVPAAYADGLEVDVGAIYVWAGGAGLTGTVDPYADLRVPGAMAGDQLTSTSYQSIFFGELTGDSTLDLVGVAAFAEIGGTPGAGAIYMWEGGAALAGTPAPRATIIDPNPGPNQFGSFSNTGFPVQLGDVSGDGQADLVVGSLLATVTESSQGALYVWSGGASLTGTPAPGAQLTIPAPAASDLLDLSVLRDLTNDGVLDVIGIAPFANVGSTENAGALYVWVGGAGLFATPSPGPTATLAVPGAVMFDELGRAVTQVQAADVDVDGYLDLIVAAPNATVSNVVRAGAVYVWRGGPSLSGSVAPFATLVVTGAEQDDALGAIRSDAYGSSVLLADVSGDGALDLVIAAPGSDVGGTVDAGRIVVWAGGTTLVGTPAPLAMLEVAGAVTGDRLGSALERQGRARQPVVIADVTGDGVMEIIGVAAGADVASVVDAGAVYVWVGGAALTGAPLSPTSTWTIPGAFPGDMLGLASQ